MILGISIVFGLYIICMIVLVIEFRKEPIFSTEKPQPITHFTIIIPFRNEAENLPSLLKSISNLNYPPELFEILFVNDASEDSSEEIVQNAIKNRRISIQLLQNKRLSNSPKKDAISEGIKHSRFDWIITTDADCQLSINWLKVLDAFIQTQSKQENIPMMVCGPVVYKSNGSFLQNFQQLDGLSLQTATIGSFALKNPILNNGANLAYHKDAFRNVNGFSGNDHIASGDDIFLMEKMKEAFPRQVVFLKSKDAIVYTKPQPNWKQLINQRIRWASKTSQQKNLHSTLLGVLVFLVNIFFLAVPVLMVFDSDNLFIYFLLVLSKVLMDYIFIRQSADFFGENIPFWKFLGLPFVYALLIVIVVFGSVKGSYSWKGRQF